MTIKSYLSERAGKCKSRLDEISKQIDEAEKKNDASQDETELKALGDELAELEAEKAELEAELKEVEAQIDALDKPAKPEGEEIIIKPERKAFLNFEMRGNETMENKNMEIEERTKKAEEFKRSGCKEFSAKEVRAVLVSSGTIATPTEVKGIEPTFNQVSSIVDLVRVENCEGMGSNKVAYEVAINTADAVTEGEEITESDPEYAFVTITPQEYGTISYLSNQVMKQSPLDYEGKIVDSTEKALRVKAANVITNAIVNSNLIAKPAGLAISAVDEKTLRNIAMNYGSNETIYGNAWLFLTKADLIAFGDIRSDTTLQAVYEITPDSNNPNTGIIKDGGLSVRYCLNPNLTPLATATAGQVSMFYGQPECAELDLFGDYEVKVSEDYQFAKNMLAIRGTFNAGCAVIKLNGFVAVTKANS